MRDLISPVCHEPGRLDRRRLLALTAAAAAMPAGAGIAYAQSPEPQRQGLISMRATFGERGQDVPGDLVWRVYAVRGSEAQLVTRSDVPRPNFLLTPGNYAIHVSHGLATAMRLVTISEAAQTGVIALNAGALIVTGYLGIPERPLPPARQRLRLFIPTANNSEGKLVTGTLRPNAVIRLPEGNYHLVSTYSGSNSVVRTDVKIDTGKLTEASVNHRAATMTLKLVRQAGGVALAGAQWTIETPGGDIVAEAVGAFPNVDIAEGSYTVLARHNEREFKGTMKVEGGINQDFEIVVGE